VDDGKPLPNTFKEIGIALPDVIMNNLASVGITKPTHIQSKAIPAILNGDDVLIQSHTGTGKTLAYALPLLQTILQDKDVNTPPPFSAIIAAPNHELVLQIQSVFEFLIRGLYPQSANDSSFVHGVFDDDTEHQLSIIQYKNPVVIVGTPRTLLGIVTGGDSTSRKVRDITSRITQSVQVLVLDEPDQIIAPLSKYAPKKQVLNRQRHPKPGWTIAKHIVDHSPGAQLICASATINRTLRTSLYAAGFNHLTLTSIGDSFRIPYHIKHNYAAYSKETERIHTLCTIYAENVYPKSALVFCDSNDSLETLANELNGLGLKAVVLHKQMEDRDLQKREAFLNSFRIGDIQLVLVSESSGRGLDFPSLEHVIILAAPKDSNSYIHMAGRTGRALMTKGTVTTIISQQQVSVLAKISQYIQVEFSKIEVK
jgi:ATP-dependent RNA helicase RhlE